MKSWRDAGPEARPDPRARKGTRWLLLTAAAATLLILYQFPLVKVTVLQHCSKRGRNGNVVNPHRGQFDWDAIDATEQLDFHPCWNGFQCAKLKVPLDWFNGTYPNASASIAIAKLPAQVSIEDSRYAGPILINPGGPGGSGIQLALLEATQLQTVVGPAAGLESTGKHYDILGFDPRGIGLTKPSAQCMPDSPSAWSWKLRESTQGILGSSDAVLGRLWSMRHAHGSACKQYSESTGEADIKSYISTASVARDMLEITERHAEWVVNMSNKTARGGLSPRARTLHGAKGPYQRGEVKLTYIGFSYGTYLGSTFASMFPDRVGRLLLDGVVNVHDYNNHLAQGSLHDTEKDMKSFYTFCATAGPAVCPLAASAASVEDIEQRTHGIIKSLYHNPIAIDTVQGPEIFTYSDLKSLIFSGLYAPTLVFPGLSHILLAIEQRTGPVLEAIADALRNSHVYTCEAGNGSVALPIGYETAQDAILCGDGIPATDLGIADMESYLHLLENISPAAAGIWALLKLRCAAWPIRPLYTFGHDANFYGETNHPILFVSNTADPVTPLRSAREMTARFPGSALLVQDAAGHCALSAPSPCTIMAAKEYFQTGELPAPNTVCVPPASPWSLNSTDPSSPFYDPSLGQAVLVSEAALEAEMEAAVRLQKWAARYLGFGRSHLGQRIDDVVRVALEWRDGKESLKDELTFVATMFLLRRTATRAISSTPSSIVFIKPRSISSITPTAFRARKQQWSAPVFQRRYLSEEPTKVGTTEAEAKKVEAEEGFAQTAAEAPVEADLTPAQEEAQAAPTDTENTVGADALEQAVSSKSTGASRSARRGSQYTTPNNTLYVGNLYYEVNADQLNRVFSRFGEIENTRVIYDNRGLSRGFAYIEFKEIKDAQAAIDNLDTQVFEGRNLVVAFHQPKENSKTRTKDGNFVANPPSKTLFIGNMSYEMSDKDLNDLFRDIRNVMDVRVAIDRRTGQPRGFAHADFIDVASATKAKERLDKKVIYGRELRIDFSQSGSNSQRPRSNRQEDSE